MRMSKIWVDSEFKKKIKIEATQNDMTILEYTKRLSENEDLLNVNENKTKKIRFKL